MTREDILKEIDRLETESFLLDMKDNWTSADYNKSWNYSIKIRELKEILNRE